MKTALRLAAFLVACLCFGTSAWSAVWSWWNIPHVAYGGGYTSYLTIRDPQAVSSRWIYVYLRDDNGALMPANLEGIGATNIDPDTNKAPYYGSSFYFSLTASQEKTFALTGTGDLKSGSVQITGEGIGNISASLRFTYRDGGKITDVVGILPAESNRDWTVTVEKGSSSDYTGIAVANPYGNSLTFNVDFYQNGSRVPGTSTKTFTLPANGHMAKFVHESALFGSAWDNFSGIGTLRISSSAVLGTFAVVALRGDGTQYSSLQADSGVQNWNVTFTGSNGPATWAWRYYDGYHFIGYEQNYEDPSHAGQRARLRGVNATDLSPAMFVADWIYASTDGSTQGMVVFQGVPSKEGSTDVINGTRTDLNKDGTIKAKVTFKATRVY